MTIEIFGYIAAFCTTLAFVPQAAKTIKEKQTKDISLAMYVIFTIGIAFWLVYGLLINSMPIIAANIVTLLLAGTILIMKIKYK
jgi:MtN3 and saliva related transmembrane protein